MSNLTLRYTNPVWTPTFKVGGLLPSIWLDGSYTPSVIHTTGTITAWNDRSGNGHNFTATGTPLTGSFNGKGVVGIDNTSVGCWFENTTFVGTGNRITLFSVSISNYSTERTANGRLWSMASASLQDYNNAQGILMGYVAANAGVWGYRNNAVLGGTAALANDTWNVLSLNRQTTQGKLSLNGAAFLTNATNIFAQSIQRVRVGNDFEETVSGINGQIAEQLCYLGLLGDTEVRIVEGYLAWRWGLQGSLAAGHPFKNNPPYA
jgi:hypothetical protein